MFHRPSPITEWNTDARKSQITIRQLDSLSSGIEDGDNGFVPSYTRVLTMAVASAAPGERFSYGPIPFQCFGENRCYVMPSIELVVIRIGDSEGDH